MVGDNKNVLGIDPGSRLCGWGVVSQNGAQIKHVDNGVIVLHKEANLPKRLGKLLASLEEIIHRYQPSAVAVEGVFQHRNPRSALVLGQARGVALAVCARYQLEVQEYSPMQVKKAVTGSGRSTKEQIQQMVALRMGLDDVPQEDAADAIAVALCHAQHLNLNLPAQVSQPRRSKRSAKAALEALVAAQERSRR